MAYYGGEEQRKKDEKKKKIDSFMDKAMPKRTFDQMGRETDRRTGKLLEGNKDLDNLIANVQGKDPKVKKRKEFKARQRQHRKDNPGEFTKAMKGVGRTERRKLFGTEMEQGLRADFNNNKVQEEKKPKPLGTMVAKAYDLDARASKEKDMDKKRKLEDRARMIQMNAFEQLDYLLSDPLEELWDLHEAMNVLPKPDLQAPPDSSYESPHKGQFEHPVTKQRNEIDSLIAQGMSPHKAHQAVHGDIDSGDIDSKSKLAATLGRLQDDGVNSGVRLEPEKGSILSKDAKIEKEVDAVTKDDLRTPMNQQVPDDQQTPQDQVAEDIDISDDYDYNEDVAFLQKFGRA